MNCTDIKILIHDFWFLSAVLLQGIAGYVSASISIIVALKCRSLHFHVNWRILIITSLILYILHSVLIAAVQTTQMVLYLTALEPCSVHLPPLACFCLRYPASVCLVCFEALQFSMVVERAVALWNRQRYEAYGPRLGITSALISIVVSLAASTWAIQDEDFKSESFYCSTITAKTVTRITQMSYGLCVIDLITLIGIIFLNIINSYAMKWFKKSYSLQSYQLRENANVIRVMLPLTIFQTMCYFLFTLAVPVITEFRSQMSLATFQTLVTSSYIIPYYTTVSPILMWFIIRWSKRMKAIKLSNLRGGRNSECDVYFQELSKMWNSVSVHNLTNDVSVNNLTSLSN